MGDVLPQIAHRTAREWSVQAERLHDAPSVD